MADHEELIAQFSSMTGSTPERANFFLEAADWDIGGALETYFDTEASQNAAEGMDVEDDNEDQQQGRGLLDWVRQGVQRVLPSAPSPAGGSGGQNESSSNKRAPPPKNPPSGSARIATLGTLKGKQESEDSSDEENGRERNQEFYVGSGQEVLGPGKKRNPDEMISSVFQSAREHGAEKVDEPSQQRGGRPNAFMGSGVRLGATPDEVKPPGTPTAVPSQALTAPSQIVPVVLRMWRNGFTIDSGDLRLYTDPANREFMEYIKQGRVPRELVSAARGGEIKVQMEDHRDQEYEKPKQPVQYFTGTGNMLGSPAPAVVTNNAPKASTSVGDRKAAEEKAKSSVTIDGSLATTNLQIRLGDGSRLVQTFNEGNTVADLRRFIQTARPEYSGQNFQILAGYPAKPITDEHVSLKDANLLNAAVTVK